MSYIAKNDAYSTLAGAITDGDNQAVVQPGDGDRFPVIEDPDYSLATLEDDFGNREIVRITLRQAASDSIVFLRAQEGTTARAWPSGTIIEVRPTAALMNSAIAHFDETAGAHQASAIALSAVGTLTATNTQDAIAELAAGKADKSQLTAAGISYAGSATLPAQTVEATLDELDDKKLTKNAKAVGAADVGDDLVNGLATEVLAPEDYLLFGDASDGFKPKKGLRPIQAPAFPAGTRMLFNQSTAPVGWTKDVSAALNDSLLRIVTGNVGSGGLNAFSSFNAITATGGTSLTVANLPAHTHSSYYQSTHPAVTVRVSTQFSGSIVLSSIGDVGHNTTTGSAGSGTAHTHSLTHNIKYNDIIIATKD